MPTTLTEDTAGRVPCPRGLVVLGPWRHQASAESGDISGGPLQRSRQQFEAMRIASVIPNRSCKLRCEVRIPMLITHRS